MLYLRPHRHLTSFEIAVKCLSITKIKKKTYLTSINQCILNNTNLLYLTYYRKPHGVHYCLVPGVWDSLAHSPLPRQTLVRLWHRVSRVEIRTPHRRARVGDSTVIHGLYLFGQLISSNQPPAGYFFWYVCRRRFTSTVKYDEQSRTGSGPLTLLRTA